MPVKLSPQVWLNNVKELHGEDTYDYSLVNYISQKEKIRVICKIHGEFNPMPMNFQRGTGCPECAILKNTKKRLSTTEEWINKAVNKHGDLYDYSLVNYVNSTEPVIIKCKKHGEFSQIPANHINQGSGCPKCLVVTTEDWIKKALLVHPDELYDYKETVYSGSEKPLNIYCKNINRLGIEHGWFTILASEHLKGTKCKLCQHQARSNNKFTWIEKAKENKGNNLMIGVKVPTDCEITKAKNEIAEFVEFFRYQIIRNDITLFDGKRIDIYIPELKLGIEYYGLHSNSDEFKSDNYHFEKTKIAESKNIRLIQIFEDEWINKQDIVKNRLKHILSRNDKKIYARKCKVKPISFSLYSKFVNTYHIQGSVAGEIYLGLFINDILIATASFGMLRKNLGNSTISSNTFELLRYCTANNYSVIGGAGKLLKRFIDIYKPKEIISYADRRWSDGNLYKKLGFELSHISEPNYYYVKGAVRHNRWNYRKDLLISRHGCTEEDTERNFTKNTLGLNRIYDSGNYVFKLKL